MGDVTEILNAIAAGDRESVEQLLPLVYDELRRLAAFRLSQERPGQTLQATALVHEAYIRLVGADQNWNGKEHFFATAAEAMRRILVESARRKNRLKRGGNLCRVDHDIDDLGSTTDPEQVLAIDDALTQLATEDDAAAEIVKLRYFAGFSIEEAAKLLGISRSNAYSHWAYAKAWLRCELGEAV